MRKFSRLWLIFAIAGLVATKSNPYADFVAGANFGELIFLFILEILFFIIIIMKKELEIHSENEVIKVLIKILSKLICIVPSIFFLSKLLLGILQLTVFKSLYVVLPDKGWSNPDLVSIVCFIIAMIFNTLLLIAFVYKGKVLKQMTNECVYINPNKQKYKKLNRICVLTLMISMIIGFFNPYEHYLTLICNLWYPLGMFIYFLNLKIARELSESSILKDQFRIFAGDQSKSFEGKGVKIFMIGVLCFIKIITSIVQFVFYSTETKWKLNFWQNKFLLDNAFFMFILATLAELAVVVIFGARIWKEKRQAD
ncbi:hypothetical protein [Inconstantimicrobium mannanitabidum]|uniref:Uncharacterized protein n=1 Tax=Inconstantimicrobium mannanitabidum TaxID=1604901 RepID=A0ACB5REI5_9CLOT|nr:hypothetical protein [Clostridium sp. TW13]GKX67540.1 hypothetical protein rsdtw13_27980 [Clostridium sp. TW13]